MADDPRVEQLLHRLLDSDASPEEVCESSPELLPVVLHRWIRMHRLNAHLDALFHAPDDLSPRPLQEDAFPNIPGYEVEAILGRGGMGVVFKARHLRLNRTVAIKTLLGGGPPARTSGNGSSGRPRRSRRCGTRTSCSFTTSARRKAGRISRWSRGRGEPALKLAGSPQPARPRPTWSPRWPTPCRRRAGGSSTAT